MKTSGVRLAGLSGVLATLWLVLVTCLVLQALPSSAEICVIPADDTEHKSETIPHMPIGGELCDDRRAFVQNITWRCEDRYCCQQPCDCDDPDAEFHEHPQECIAQGKTALEVRCYVRHKLNSVMMLKKCCANFVENQAGFCVEDGPCVDSACTQACVDNGDGTFHCECDPGLVLDADGFTCSAPHPCFNSRCSDTCVVDEGGWYYCECRPGYELASDRVTCIETDPCEGTKCSHICVNDGGGNFHCECHTGFVLDADDFTCIDPCEDAGCSHDCYVDGTGTAYCTCDPPNQLDGDRVSCIVPDPCEDPKCSDICVNDGGGNFHCECYTGFVLDADDFTCIDPCENAGCSQDCSVDKTGMAHCTCRSPFRLDRDRVSCVVPDPCEDTKCSHICVNDGGGNFHCECRTGFVLDADDFTCLDPCQNAGCSQDCYVDVTGMAHCTCESPYRIDRDGVSCIVPDPCEGTKCSDICVSDGGGNFHCECHTGFVLDADGFTCIVPDSCFNMQCSGGQCIDDGNGQFHCQCPTGYEVTSSDLLTCIDINECEGVGNRCAGLCENTEGNYQCSCEGDLLLAADGFSCYNPCDCSATQVCVTSSSGRYCGCAGGYMPDPTDRAACVDINECLTNGGGCSHTCVNLPGTYRCDCPTDQGLHADGKTCQEPNVNAESNAQEKNDGVQIPIVVGVPLALLLLLVLLIPLLCFIRRRRRQKKKGGGATHVGDDSRAFSNDMYEVTPGQVPVVVPAGIEGAVGNPTEPHYETLPEKKTPVEKGAVGPEPEPLYATSSKKGTLPGGSGPVVYAAQPMPSTSKQFPPAVNDPPYEVLVAAESGTARYSNGVNQDNLHNIISEESIYAEVE